MTSTEIGGLVVYMRPTWGDPTRVNARLARWSAAVALLLALVPLVLVRLDYDFHRDRRPRRVHAPDLGRSDACERAARALERRGRAAAGARPPRARAARL